jgi:DNA-binding transcriptional regulator YdaS (Cro superfamily)
MKMPSYINDLPVEDQKAARMRFLLTIAAAYATTSCQLNALAVELGISSQTIYRVANGDSDLAPALAVAIEKIAGRDVLPREVLRPDLFVVEPNPMVL